MPRGFPLETREEAEMARDAPAMDHADKISDIIRLIVFEARVFKNEPQGVAWSRSVNDLIRKFSPDIRKL
jgi:hypothetical protein